VFFLHRAAAAFHYLLVLHSVVAAMAALYHCSAVLQHSVAAAFHCYWQVLHCVADLPRFFRLDVSHPSDL